MSDDLRKCTFIHLTDEQAAKNVAENRMFVQLPHERFCDLNDQHLECCGIDEEKWVFGPVCTCATWDVVAKLRDMGWKGAG